jgi:glycyl-tRNA synthetase
MEKVISLCKRRGFVFPSSEIYGGFSSSYDFGPLGVLLKNNIKKHWLDSMFRREEDIVGLDAAILMSPKVWQASGHLSAGFADELVECKKCHKRYKKEELKENKCPECGGQLTKPKQFNLMMKTFVGSIEDENTVAYLRPETCQGIYVNFKNVLETMRKKIPFGIAQIGKAFRNEITTKNFIFRTCEFEQMEMQWFCNPQEADKWFDFWKKERLDWYINLGIDKKKLRMQEIPEKERAHYAKRQIDLEYEFPFGWKEIEGIHNRGDWDLSRHKKFSKEDLGYKDPIENEDFVPYVIETSVGVERSLLAFLADSYQEVSGGRTKTTKSTKETETVLKLNKKLAPIKIAVLPLLKNKPELVKKAKEIYRMLLSNFMCQHDEKGAIGRRYRRQDEIGTPFCVTVDFETLKDEDVTVRDRNTMKQERVKIDNLKNYLGEKLNN